MRNPVVAAAARRLMPLMLIFASVLLLRGHNFPGGGFVGGLVAALTFVLYAIAFGGASAQAALRVRPVTLIAFGLTIAAATAVWGLAEGALLKGVWPGIAVPGAGELGSPLLFDAGVFLTVCGAVLAVFFELVEG